MLAGGGKAIITYYRLPGREEGRERGGIVRHWGDGRMSKNNNWWKRRNEEYRGVGGGKREG